MKYEIEFLNLNRHNFNYGYLGKYSGNEQIIRIYVAFRLLLLIDQLHDFLEKGEDRNKFFQRAAKDDKTTKNANTIIQLDIYNNIVNSAFTGIQNKTKELFPTETLQTLNKNDPIQIQSPFFGKCYKFFDLFLEYFGITYKKFTVEDIPLILTGKNKYIIADEILLRIFSIEPVSFEDVFLKNQSNYNCSSNIEYINNFCRINYKNRYYRNIDVDTTNTYLTVDADKSKYGVSEITKQACGFEDAEFSFIQTVATNYDSANTSTTYSLLKYIQNRNKKIKDNNTTIDIIDITKNGDISYEYSITIGGIEIINFTYFLQTQTDNLIPTFLQELDKLYSQKLKQDKKDEKIDILLEDFYSKISKDDTFLKYITKTIDNLKLFIKEYTFADETVLHNKDDGDLHIDKFMKNPPYNIPDFKFNKNTSLGLKEFKTFMTGIYSLYINIKDRITLENYMEEIFPGYKKIVNLYVKKFFEIERPTGTNKLTKIIKIIKDKSENVDNNVQDMKEIIEKTDKEDLKYFFRELEINLLELFKDAKITIPQKKVQQWLHNYIVKNVNSKFNISETYIEQIINTSNNYSTRNRTNAILDLLYMISETIVHIKDKYKIDKNRIYNVLFDEKFNFIFNQNNSSVAKITELVIEKYKDKLRTEVKIPFILTHKTIGDFGQIISFYCYDKIDDSKLKKIQENIGIQVMDVSFGVEKRKTSNEDNQQTKKTKIQTQTNPPNSVCDKVSKLDGGKISKDLKDELKDINCVKVKHTNDEIVQKLLNVDNKTTYIPNHHLKYFITFDALCSRISSLFNHGTIYEATYMTISPLQMFDNVCAERGIEELTTANK